LHCGQLVHRLAFAFITLSFLSIAGLLIERQRLSLSLLLLLSSLLSCYLALRMEEQGYFTQRLAVLECRYVWG